jgi:hypothetical protein
MFEVAATMVWLQTRLFDVDTICRDHKPKGELARAIDFLRTSCSAASARLQPEDIAIFTALPGLGPLLVGCVAWFEVAWDTTRHISRWFVLKYLGEVRAVAEQLAKATPSFEHIVGSEVLNLKLAKSNLLAWPSRPQLNKLVVSMYHCIHEASRLHSQWALAPPLAEDPTTKDDIATAEHLFAAGRKAILVIAGVNILLAHSGDHRSSWQRSLWQRSATLCPKH